MTAASNASFVEMARAFPIRTAVFTFVPVLFVLGQLAVTVVHGGSVLYTAAFSVAIVAYAVLAHQYHLAAFQRARLSSFRAGYGRRLRSD